MGYMPCSKPIVTECPNDANVDSTGATYCERHREDHLPKDCLTTEDTNAKIATLEARLRAADDEAEQLRVQLAGCGVAALDGSASQEAKPGDYGWSASYAYVLSLRRRFDAQTEKLRAAMNDRGAAHLALRVAENAVLAAQGEGEPDPEHGHAPMGLFELGLNAGEEKAPEECPFVADAERLSDILKAALAAIRTALPAEKGETPPEQCAACVLGRDAGALHCDKAACSCRCHPKRAAEKGVG